MKKCISIFILACLYAYDLQAQFEITVGVAFDPQSFASNVTANPTSLIGGIGYGIPIFKKISLKPELLYTQYKFLYRPNVHVSEFQLPLMINIRLSKKFDIHGGVLFDRQYLSDTAAHYTYTWFALGSGFALSSRVRLQARYLPFPNYYGTVQLTLAYIAGCLTSRRKE